MSSLHRLDARILDATLSTMNSVGGLSAGVFPRPRYNTQIMARFIQPQNLSPEEKQSLARNNVANGRPLVTQRYWDADLQSYTYLQDFTEKEPAWRNKFADVAKGNGLLSQEMNPVQLGDQVCGILELAPEREERFMEVIDQDDADGAVNYWLGMLQISPARHPATYLMVRIGRRIGEHVAMCLKGRFKSPRPSRLCPGIVPMIDPPDTPTFPAGHAVQAYLMSCLLAGSLPRIPQQPFDKEHPEVTAEGPLFKLAYRVSENRIVAGVHFPTDIEAGKAVGFECFKVLREVPAIQDLMAEVRKEFPQYAPEKPKAATCARTQG